jgi:drug/metabolite transporter (DMT)-like permease
VLGGLIALLSAATFAFNNASVRRGVLTGSVLQAMAITVPIGLPISFLVAVATGSLAAVAGFSSRALLALSLSGIMHFVWGRYCNYRATRAIGTNLVAPVQQINLIFTLLLAIWILGETLTPLRVLGIALVLLGPKHLAPTSPATTSRAAPTMS